MEKDSKKEEKPVFLELRNISYQVIKKDKGNKHGLAKSSIEIIHNVSCSINEGDFVAIMGASGAGKSTLLNILCRRIKNHDGEVLVKNEPADKSPVIKNGCCFIHQEDAFCGFLTVEEHLRLQTDLRVSLPDDVKKTYIHCVSRLFGLQKCENLQIGNVAEGATRGISGGEKKRLSVATELLSVPSLIVADECTSGLDSCMAERLINTMRTLTTLGKTVVCTIHQPSSDIFAKFTKLLLLSEGRVIYYGPSVGVIPYFEKLGHSLPAFVNPAEFALEVISEEENPGKAEDRDGMRQTLADIWVQNSREFLDEWETKLKKEYKEDMLICKDQSDDKYPEPENLQKEFDVFKHIPGELDKHKAEISLKTKCKAIATRNIISTFRDPSLIRFRNIQNIVQALIMGLVYFRLKGMAIYSKPGAVFMILMSQAFMHAFTVISSCYGERMIIQRERDSGLYSMAIYLTSKMLSDFFFQLYLPLVYIMISWFMMGLNDNFLRFLAGLGITFLIAMSTSAVGYLVVSATTSPNVALAIGTISLLPASMVSGFTIRAGSIPSYLYWLHVISPFTYGFSALMRCIFLNQFNDIPVTGNEVLKEYKISTSSGQWGIDIAVLLAWGIMGRMIAVALFSFTNRPRGKN